jgi:hypothetical protein
MLTLRWRSHGFTLTVPIPENPEVSWGIPFIMAETALFRADTLDDVLPAYRNTPVESLLRFHNMREPLPATYDRPQLLIGMCMDHRHCDCLVRWF